MEIEIKLSTYKTKRGLQETWEVWYHDKGLITIHSSSEWECREDAEQGAIERMLDGKI